METLVTIAVMSIGVIGLALSMSSAQILARDSVVQSQFAAYERGVSDALRSLTAAYVSCATTASYSGVVSTVTAPASTQSVVVFALDLMKQPSSDNASGYLALCGATQDWGVQRLTLKFKDTASGLTLYRVVYKTWHP